MIRKICAGCGRFSLNATKRTSRGGPSADAPVVPMKIFLTGTRIARGSATVNPAMNKPQKILAFVAGFAALIAAGVVLTQQANAATVPPYDPRRLTHVGDARQLIVVTGLSPTSSYATARTYEKGADGQWAPK